MKNSSWRLILKNSFRNTFNNKAQLFGLTMLVTLLALIISITTAISTRVIENHDKLIANSNQHNIVLQLDPFENVTTGDSGNTNVPTNVVEAQQHWVYNLQEQYFNESSDLQFDWSRTEAREFTQVFNNNQEMTLKAIAKFTTKGNTPVDQLVISKGRDIETSRDVVLDPTFAKENNIEIGSIIRLQKDTLGNEMFVNSKKNDNTSDIQYADIQKMTEEGLNKENGLYQTAYRNYNWYQVVGYGNSADFMMPIINASSPLPNKTREGLIYVSPETFGLKKDENSRKGLYLYDASSADLVVSSNNELESFYSIKTKKDIKLTSSMIDEMNSRFKQLIGKQNTDNVFIYAGTDSAYRYSGRTQSIEKTLLMYNIAATVIAVIVLVVCLYTMGLITRKQIEKTRGQIGTMKALGYRKRKLVLGYVMTPFFTAIVGGILGFLIAQSVQIELISIFSSYFSMDFQEWTFDIFGFGMAVLLMWIILTGISFWIAYAILKDSALDLIQANKGKKISKFGMMIKKMNIRDSFRSKMRTALFVDASGKMFGVGLVVLLATVSLTVAFAAPDILTRNKTASYKGIKYKQVVEYAEPTYNNPYTFLKTYNGDVEAWNKEVGINDVYNYSDVMKSVTGLPLDENGNYDMDYIIKDYYNGTMKNEYYSMLLNSAAGDGEMTSIEMMLSNLKMLNGYNVVITDAYFRYLADIGMPGDAFGWKILGQQWPDIVELAKILKSNSVPGINNPTEDDIYRFQFKILQQFYTKYVNSIGLSITNTYYGEDIDPMKNTHKEKIESFNSDSKFANKAYEDFIKNEEGFNEYLSALRVNEYKPFQFSDGENKALGQFRIIDNDWNTNQNEVDEFSMKSASTLSAEEIKEKIPYYLNWYAALFSFRSDQAIIQAGYSRSPYFVKQYIKEGYYGEQTYNQSFGVIAYDSKQEQIGTKINVKDMNSNFGFNIYGIENNTDFIELTEAGNHQILNSRLYEMENAENAIIINETIAKKMDIGIGDVVDLEVLQNELQDLTTSEPTAMELDSWDAGTVRNVAKDSKFTQFSQLKPTSASVTNNQGKKLAFSGSSIDGSTPGALYGSSLKGETTVGTKKTPTKFTIVGVHEGYGTAQAWIKEESAQKILSYDKVEAYLWNNQFRKQWANEFNNDVYKEFELNGEQTSMYLPKNLNDITYDEFINNYVNGKDTEVAVAAKNILQIFKNANPIFNYKYSNKDDVGDLKSLIAISQKYGDYSPLAMNGSVTDDRIYDGAGEGAMANIVPIAISQAILAQMSEVIMMLLIMVITLLIVITFVIILLTTSLVINDNKRFIATLKVLGYSDPYIVKNVLGMYFIVIAVTFVTGFGFGFWAFSSIIRMLYTVGSLVLPLAFPIFLPFAVLASIVGIYAITIAVGFNSIRKLNAVHALKDGDL